jgi:YD repeat-containing protein
MIHIIIQNTCSTDIFICPFFSTLNINPDGNLVCSCDSGYFESNNQCFPSCPDNAITNGDGICSCSPGYIQSGSACVLQQPDNPTDFNSNDTGPDAPCTGNYCGGDGGGPAGGGGGGCGSTGMCALTTTLPLVNLRLFDTPVGYTPPVGYDVHTTLTYNQLEAALPASMDYSNIGPQWSTSWVGFIQDNPTQPGVSMRRIAAGGGAYDYTGYNSANGSFAAKIRTSMQLVLVSQNPVTYEQRFTDGSKEVYAVINGATAYPRRVFLSRIVDPYGNTLTLNYDANLRLISVQDAIGQRTVFAYGNTANPWLITSITDPFGRSAQLAYDSQGRLASINDAVGITSRFDYGSASTGITALHTPYGTTSFAATATAIPTAPVKPIPIPTWT